MLPGAITPWLMPLAGCAGRQSALDPQGPGARLIHETWIVMLVGGAIILAVVTALALYAVLRSPEKRTRIHGRALTVGGGLVFPIVALTALVVYGTRVGAALRAASVSPTMRIEVIGHQWWWEMRYPHGSGFVAAVNELRLPAGETVEITLRSADVIHSFWVPNLAGKVDLIPGRTNRLVLRADAPGLLRGQCAEFCGADGHARMALAVVVEPRAQFERWLAAQPPGGRSAP